MKKLWYFASSGSLFLLLALILSKATWSFQLPVCSLGFLDPLQSPPPILNRSEHTNSTKTEQGKHGRSEEKCVGMFSGPIEVVVLLFPPAVNCPKPSMFDMHFPLFSFSTTSHETAAPPYQSDITTSKSARLCASIKCLCFSTCDLERLNSQKQCPYRKL